MADEKIQIMGLAELNKKLSELGGLAAQKKGGEILAKAPAQYIARIARKNIKRFERTGNLRKSVAVVKRSKAKYGHFVYYVGNRTGKGAKHDGWYGALVEFGTPPHEIKAVNAKALGIRGVFGKIVHHPGSRPQPWLRPAFDTSWHEALESGRKKYAKYLEKVAAK